MNIQIDEGHIKVRWLLALSQRRKDVAWELESLPAEFPNFGRGKDLAEALGAKDSAFSNWFPHPARPHARDTLNRPPPEVARNLARIFGFAPPSDDDHVWNEWWAKSWPSFMPSEDDKTNRKQKGSAEDFKAQYREALKNKSLTFRAPIVSSDALTIEDNASPPPPRISHEQAGTEAKPGAVAASSRRQRSMQNDQTGGPERVNTTRQCLDEVSRRLGISRRGYAVAFWAMATFSAALTFNVYSRTQKWHFNLIFAPSFNEPSSYGVAAIGSFSGGAILLIVLGMLYVYSTQWGRCYRTWVGRVPSFSAEIAPSTKGTLLPVIHAAALAVVIGFPLVGQVHFVDKFLAATSKSTTTGLERHGWYEHLFTWVPLQECTSFVYDGQEGFSYCELLEPWAVVTVATVLLFLSALVVYRLFYPRIAG
jgi:hypothetical protein